MQLKMGFMNANALMKISNYDQVKEQESYF